MYHPESCSLFELDASELQALYQSGDGALCNDVTGDPKYERAFRLGVEPTP